MFSGFIVCIDISAILTVCLFNILQEETLRLTEKMAKCSGQESISSQLVGRPSPSALG